MIRAGRVLALCLAVGACSRSKAKAGDGKCASVCNHCDADEQCHDCSPDNNTCHGGHVVTCNPEGTFGEVVKLCDLSQGETCLNGACLSSCDVAASTRSYIGCDYWPVTLLNSQLNPYFDFAVAVANPLVVGDVVQSAAAQITVTQGNNVIKKATVTPGSVETILLPWVADLSQNDTSALVPDGAYHLVSSIPVTVYQFNPLQFEKPATPDCQDSELPEANCHSFTNDASILLPATAVGQDYLVIARGTFAVDGTPLPGFFAVVATAGGTTQVTVTSSAYTEAGSQVAAMKPKQTQVFALSKGQVLQVVSEGATAPCKNMSSDGLGDYCDLGPAYDLTGTHVTADQPIVVFGGHACSFVPYNKYACDHLEEQLPPVDTWGQTILAVQTKPQTVGEPNYWRVISGSDANLVEFEPSKTHAAVALSAGEFVEFMAHGAFRISGTGRIALGQFMVGESYISNSITVGDPSLGLGVPVEQYRSSYDFLAPSTYKASFATLTMPKNVTLQLDGQPVGGVPAPISSTGYNYLYVPLKPGAHHITGNAPFGITVSGVASYTSYLYVGGQNLNEIPVQ